MNYEKKYKEALERAKKLQKTCDSQAVVGWCEYLFPELRWSERDKEEFQIAIDTLVEVGQHSSANWLKSLKQRIGWKPSEEQIDALEEAMYQVGILTPLGSEINDLYEQLKKLKGV